MNAESILKAKYPSALVDEILAAYREVESNYALGKWKVAALDAGHFVEAARRLIEQSLFGRHTPTGIPLPKFNDPELKKYENATGEESLRILVPRVLYGVYAIRNKRGVAHIGAVSPNEMDATLTLSGIKWSLAELVRLAAGIATAESQRLVDQLVERQLPILWDSGAVKRVLATSLTARDQVLVLLYDSAPQSISSLQNAIEYKNRSSFRAIVQELHKQRFVEVNKDEQCQITPRGMAEAERLIREHDSATGAS